MKALIILALAAVALALPASARTGSEKVLVGTVGPGFTIGLTDAAGTPVTSVPAGHYTFVVHDLSAEHNFVFADQAGVRLTIQTDVEFVGDQTFEVDLTPGRYAYACAPHWQVMNGRLAAYPPTVAKPKPKAKPKKHKPKKKVKKKT